MSPENATVKAGSTVYMTCVGYGGEADTWITWSKDGNELFASTRLNFNSSIVTEGGLSFVVSILEICSVEDGDMGMYSCKADNGIGNDTSNFFLTVTPVGGTDICVMNSHLFPFECHLILSVCDLLHSQSQHR